jgi:hypothetical protein
MALKKCVKCGELADKAKAFCPECGNSFENESVRKEDSEFELSSGTMRITGSAFDLMLSDMGLNISEISDDPAENASVDPAPDPQKKAGSTQSPSALRSFPLLAGVAVMALIIAVIIAVVYAAYFR